MALVDLIYNFYFTYIFNTDNSFLGFVMVQFPEFEWGTDLGGYLSATMTIITLVLICIMLIRLVIWLFSLFANMLGGR